MTSNIIQCQVCQLEAIYMCNKCKDAYYCSSEHQKAHWPGHKKQCEKYQPKNQKQEVSNISELRKTIRKTILQFYSFQKYDQCLIHAKILESHEQKNLKDNFSAVNQFEYAATICLKIKIYSNMGEKKSAILTLQKFLKSNTILKNVSMFTQNNTIKFNQLFLKKLSLISNLANLSYQLQLPHIDLYILYADNMQLMFGEKSKEYSNCLFMLGTYYANHGHLLKALACFQSCSQIRQQESGSCFFNIGKKLQSIVFFEKSLKSRMDEYGKSSNEVAQVLENLGLIYLEQFDFVTAFHKFEQAYDIRQSSEEGNNNINQLNQLILFGYSKLNAFINYGSILVEKTEIYTHLRQLIKDNQKWTRDLKKKLNQIYLNNALMQIPNEWKQQFDQNRDKRKFKMNPEKLMKLDIDGYFQEKISNPQQQEINQAEPDTKTQLISFVLNIDLELLSSFNFSQHYHLSKLQLELEKCISQFRAEKMCLKSKLFELLDEEKKNAFKLQNTHIFKTPMKGKEELDRKNIKRSTTKVPKLQTSNLKK